MNVQVHLNSASQPMTFNDVENTYEKGGLFCVLLLDGNGDRYVRKFPLVNIFDIVETYD